MLFIASSQNGSEIKTQRPGVTFRLRVRATLWQSSVAMGNARAEPLKAGLNRKDINTEFSIAIVDSWWTEASGFET